MTDKPTKEQVKEFWEWYGFKVEYCHHKYCAYEDKNHTHIYPPDKVGKKNIDYGAINSYPKLDLNSLFKHAVPLALEKLARGKGGDIYLAKWSLLIRWMEIWDIIKDPTLALFWVLRQVKEKSNE